MHPPSVRRNQCRQRQHRTNAKALLLCTRWWRWLDRRVWLFRERRACATTAQQLGCRAAAHGPLQQMGRYSTRDFYPTAVQQQLALIHGLQHNDSTNETRVWRLQVRGVWSNRNTVQTTKHCRCGRVSSRRATSEVSCKCPISTR